MVKWVILQASQKNLVICILCHTDLVYMFAFHLVMGQESKHTLINLLLEQGCLC
jgi:hypothetical protein